MAANWATSIQTGFHCALASELNLLASQHARGRKACQTRVTTKDLRTMIDTHCTGLSKWLDCSAVFERPRTALTLACCYPVHHQYRRPYPRFGCSCGIACSRTLACEAHALQRCQLPGLRRRRGCRRPRRKAIFGGFRYFTPQPARCRLCNSTFQAIRCSVASDHSPISADTCACVCGSIGT